MRLDNVKTALENAAKQVIFQARANLGVSKPWKQNDGSTRVKKIDTSGELWKSLQATPIDDADGKLSISILMEYYGKFIDQGVSGTRYGTPEPSPFKFRNDGVGPDMKKGIFDWIRAKNMRLRDLETGKFKKGTPAQYNSLAYVIARSVKRKGINQTYFITTPFAMMQEKLPTILQKAFAADAEQYLKEQLEKK